MIYGCIKALVAAVVLNHFLFPLTLFCIIYMAQQFLSDQYVSISSQIDTKVTLKVQSDVAFVYTMKRYTPH